MDKKVIVIDGIIAAGKSFTLSRFANHPNINICAEPVHLYRSYANTRINALGEFYRNPKENGVCLQLYVIECLESILKELSGKHILSERYLTSVHPFTQTMFQNGWISQFSATYIFKKLNAALSRVSQVS